jgi:hypothetical protein
MDRFRPAVVEHRILDRERMDGWGNFPFHFSQFHASDRMDGK